MRKLWPYECFSQDISEESASSLLEEHSGLMRGRQVCSQLRPGICQPIQVRSQFDGSEAGEGHRSRTNCARLGRMFGSERFLGLSRLDFRFSVSSISRRPHDPDNAQLLPTSLFARTPYSLGFPTTWPLPDPSLDIFRLVLSAEQHVSNTPLTQHPR